MHIVKYNFFIIFHSSKFTQVKKKYAFDSLEDVKALNHTFQGQMPFQINRCLNEIPIKAFVFSRVHLRSKSRYKNDPPDIPLHFN